MKSLNTKLFLLISTLIFTITLQAKVINIIPRPNDVKEMNGNFSLNHKSKITYDSIKIKETAKQLQTMIKNKSGLTLKCEFSTNKPQDNTINLTLKDKKNEIIGSYKLEINKQHITMQATTTTGLFYACQSLHQLLVITPKNTMPSLPNIIIKDQPRFAWRGYMLDESRHFFGKDSVKQILDIMAYHKMNIFHWHLTDSNGWRIEIKKYPKLATIGGIGDKSNPNGKAQFYTQEEIKEIINYAKERHIMIIPEIDMPGHAESATRAYPEFSGGNTKKRKGFTFNPGDEATYKFLEDILREVAELFPAPYIHLGGDEVHFGNQCWNTNPHVKKLMKDKKLANLVAVEHYFINRMTNYINTLGKTTLGWDEIINAKVATNKSAIMWWRHNIPKMRDKAIKQGYQVILCPRLPCYFDFVQHKSHKVGRRWGGFCDLKSVYKYPFIPKNYNKAEQKQIMGLQANLWSETVKSQKRLHFMTFPRLAALSEAAWTNDTNKDYQNFMKRLPNTLAKYKKLGIYYFDPFNPTTTKEPTK